MCATIDHVLLCEHEMYVKREMMNNKMNFGLMENILCDEFLNSLSPVKRFFKIFGKKKKNWSV